jgi:hypothetical protein
MFLSFRANKESTNQILERFLFRRCRTKSVNTGDGLAAARGGASFLKPLVARSA